MAFDPLFPKHAIDPVSVETSLLTTTKGKTFPVLASAFFRSCAKRSSSPATSPPRTACFDIFSPPSGDSDVISHLDLLSSNETNIAPRCSTDSVRFFVSGVWMT